MPNQSLGSMFPSFFGAVIYGAAPLTIAAMGGILSERSGVVNIALEGLMLFGAFAAVWAETAFSHRGVGAFPAAILGLLAAVLAGALLGLLHAFLTQRTRMDHVVSGLGINLLAAGATRYLYLFLYPTGVSVSGLPRSFFVGLAVVLPFIVLWALWRTRFGLRLRAVGENPESALMAGISPGISRYAAVTLSGVLAAVAGAYLSLADSHTFASDISAGKGYIALAAVIFGKWNPLGAAGGALFFGFFYALQTQLQISNVHLRLLGVEWSSPFLLDTLPYIMTIMALVSVVGKAAPPAALGRATEES